MKKRSSSKKTRPAKGEEVAGGSGSRPYHECSFCKNGFNTAQALGGHMNIHRRDRARRSGRDTSAATGTASAASPAYAYPPPSAPTIAIGGSFATYYSEGASAAADAMSFGGASGQRDLNLFGAPATGDQDLRLGVGSCVLGEWGPSASEAEGSTMDLELRLGRHPTWR